MIIGACSKTEKNVRGISLPDEWYNPYFLTYIAIKRHLNS